MALFTKETLETLRQRIDLVDCLSTHIELKPAGASFKALCPFHDEKSPSFVIQRGEHHYHCFGCGAHGDAIHFLMNHLKMSFTESVQNLAQRYNIPLQFSEANEEEKGPNKSALKEALELANQFYQFMLLHTPEGHEAVQYLYRRGIDLDFIRQFGIGLAPSGSGLLRKVLHKKFIKDLILEQAGLIQETKNGGWRDFFQDRITFPICDAMGSVIGFSARKYKESTLGGKYINTAETALFKKSRVLFALHHSRRRICKERKVIVVEGQIDALRLISVGFGITVAGQGTAFGEGHVKELTALGINQVFLALDSDEAGRQAVMKIGDLFQKCGIEVRVISLPIGSDPDSFLRENGAEAFLELMNSSTDYITFAVELLSRKLNMNSPAGKNELVKELIKKIRSWDQPLMVHESLRKLAHLVRVPEEMVGVGQDYVPNLYVKKYAAAGAEIVDPDKILEGDFLHWLLLEGEQQSRCFEIAEQNLKPEDLRHSACQGFYRVLIGCFYEQKKFDLISLAIQLEEIPGGQELLSELLHKKINRDRMDQQLRETVQKILDRNWMHKREEIKTRIQTGQLSEEEVFQLVKQFDQIKRSPPKVLPLSPPPPLPFVPLPVPE
jgi:DNA primase